MHQAQRQRTHELLKAKGIERAIFANFSSVKWLTGFTPTLQTGPNFFAGGPPMVWYEAGHFTLFVVDSFAADAAAFDQEADGSVVTYQGYTIQQPIAGPEHLAKAFQKVVARSGRGGGPVGVEEADVTVMVSAVLQNALLSSGVRFTPIDGWLVPLRMVKTEEELVKIRENFALTNLAQAAARQAVAVGKREIDVWTAIHSAVEQAAGHRVPLGNDCVVGHRQANIGGWPLDHEIRPNDSVIVDLSTILHGYWSDSCGTYYANEPTPQQVAMHKTAAAALEFAISLIKPGAVAREVDQKVRQFMADAGYAVYPHHTGHGVGVSGHEGPRIVPYCEDVLAEGMVIMLEPGIYLPGETGVRLEDGMLVTADGVELLTNFDKSLS
jgi:Xaa-Pro aminopeptidase